MVDFDVLLNVINPGGSAAKHAVELKISDETRHDLFPNTNFCYQELPIVLL